MGQYYNCVAFGEEKNTEFYNPYGLKLCEANYPTNDYTNMISEFIYHNPVSIVWVGDYANSENGSANDKFTKQIFNAAWGEERKNSDRVFPKQGSSFDYSHKYVVNHTKNIAFALDDLNNPFAGKFWIMYPIALLCAIGNGLGGGDYHESYPNCDMVGEWATDVISIEDEIPNGYSKIPFIKFES